MSPQSDERQLPLVEVLVEAPETPQNAPQKLGRHAELCAIAVRWLRRPHSAGGPGCLVAVSEVAGGWTGEIPDAIGFSHSWGEEGATVIEVKVSRSDFLADRKKPHRQDGQGMGTWRYFMAPEGLIAVEELRAGWGLIEVNKRGHCKVLAGAMRDTKNLGYDARRAQVEAWRQQADVAREQWLLVRLLARLGDVEALNTERKDLFRHRDEFFKRMQALNEENAKLRRENALYRFREQAAARQASPDDIRGKLAIPRQASVTA